jgi:DNA-binding transcriptional regulator YiaG
MNRATQNDMHGKGGFRGAGCFDIHATFAASFRNWRQENNLTLKEVAFDLGISISTVNSWELGVRFPSGQHLEMLVNYTGHPPCWFFCVKSDDCVVPAESETGSMKKSAIVPGRSAISTLSVI